jgi:hypothetical protein
MDFFEYLERQRHRLDPVGDLARDIVSATVRPRAGASREQWRTYLRATGAVNATMRALDDAGREFGGE